MKITKTPQQKNDRNGDADQPEYEASTHCFLLFQRDADAQHRSWRKVPSARKWLTDLGVLTAHPRAFLIVLCYAALRLLFARDTFDWHALATLATWLMTLVIQ